MSNVVQVQPIPKPKLSVWSDLSVHNVDQINSCKTADETKLLLQKLFELDDSPRSNILLDLYLNTLQFAKTHNFKKGQKSALFSIIKQTHEVCTSTPFGNVQDCFQFFHELILAHSVHRPPWSLEVYNSQQIEEITNFVINTYFRHYKLYKYAFTPRVRLDLSISYVGRAPSPEPEEEIENIENKSVSANSTSGTTTPVEEKVEESTTSVIPDHDEAVSELEVLVRKAVGSQLKQMQISVDKQLEKTEKNINDKIQILEQGGNAGAATPKAGKKSPKSSGKGKRK